MEKTTTTTYSGTVTEVKPSASTIVLRSQASAAPQTYAFTEKTTLVDSAGNVVTWDSIKNAPVTVHYTDDGGRMVVTKVVTTKPVGELRKETTTTTTERTIDE